MLSLLPAPTSDIAKAKAIELAMPTDLSIVSFTL